MATTAKIDVLDQTFRTSDGRILFVYSDPFLGRLEIRLGNIGRFPFSFENEGKCRSKFKRFIKDLDAVQVD